MSTQRERRPSIVPTVYHTEDDVTVRRPPRVYYEEVVRDRPRRSSSVSSRPAASRHEDARQHETVEPNSPIHITNKPAFIESVVETDLLDDEKEYEEKVIYVEKPYTAEDRSYVENPFSARNSYVQRGRNVQLQPPVSRYSKRISQPSKLRPADNTQLWWSQMRRSLRDPFSEFFGTFILVLFGEGSIAQVVLSKGTKGNYQSICWGWGVGVMIGAYVAGISGSNLNPAVTLANCIFRKQPWRSLPVYAIAQTLGAFCAGGVVYSIYYDAIDLYEGVGIRTVPGYSDSSTAGIFANYPQPFLNKTGDFFSEFIGSAILLFCVYALQDKFNRGADKFIPLALFFVLYGIGACFGWETGYSINPARDFGPRLMTYFLGYGNEVWTAAGHYFWVPLIAPLFGCVFGGWLYDLFIYIGESPVNTPWIGFKQICRPGKSEHRYGKSDDSPV